MYLLFLLNHSYKDYTKFSKTSKKCSQLKKKRLNFLISVHGKKTKTVYTMHYSNNIQISNGNI